VPNVIRFPPSISKPAISKPAISKPAISEHSIASDITAAKRSARDLFVVGGVVFRRWAPGVARPDAARRVRRVVLMSLTFRRGWQDTAVHRRRLFDGGAYRLAGYAARSRLTASRAVATAVLR